MQMQMRYEYNNGLCSGGRTPRLYLAKGREIVKFQGANIPGFCAIASEKYEKNGKWSNTTYHLSLLPGVRPLHFLSPLHGMWGDNLESWGAVAEKLGLPVEVAQALIRNEYKKTAERLDNLEALILESENAGSQTELVIVSFGSPTNRQIANGYWDLSKRAQTSNGIDVIVEPGPDGWGKPVVVEPEGAKVIGAKSSPGMHGGYWNIEVLVPIS